MRRCVLLMSAKLGCTDDAHAHAHAHTHTHMCVCVWMCACLSQQLHGDAMTAVRLT
jgi:hypothetical protein